MAAETIDAVFQEFAEQGWNQDSKWTLLTRWLDQTPKPYRSNESLRDFLENQFQEECGWNDQDEINEFPQDDLELK